MEQAKLYPKYRWVIAPLFMIVSMMGVYFLTVTAPLFTDMRKDLNVSLTMIGYTSTIVTTFQGFFMFVGAILIGKWGVKRGYIISAMTHLVLCQEKVQVKCELFI